MHEKKGVLFKFLRLVGALIPGDYLKTLVYLNCIYRPRKYLRRAVTKFYRMDHVYEVLGEFKNLYRGNFSILEFGVADGYAFNKILYAVRYLDMEDRVTVHGFDTFEGLPEQTSSADDAVVRGAEWSEGHYSGRYEELQNHCSEKYSNFELHRGLFGDTIDGDVIQQVMQEPPILIWIDCDYYSSARTVFERLLPNLPSGCVVYFDDIYFNYGSRFTGERKLVWEINQGEFGDGVELVLDSDLSWDSNRVYRLINLQMDEKFELRSVDEGDPVRRRRDGSPFP